MCNIGLLLEMASKFYFPFLIPNLQSLHTHTHTHTQIYDIFPVFHFEAKRRNVEQSY